MKELFAVLLFIPFLFGCGKDRDIQDKFNTLSNIDYSIFGNISIVNRKGTYLVTYHGVECKIKRNNILKNIRSIVSTDNEDINVLLTKDEIKNVENILKSFDKLKALALSIDEKRNVFLSIPWYDGCTYYFLKLSQENTLEDINKNYYHSYEDNWYLYKECSEK